MPSYTNLILRTLTSPYGDITRGGVLSWNDVDQNFLYLKSELIYDVETSGQTITLKKFNGNNITFPYTDVYVTGGTYVSGSATFTNNTGGTFTVTGFASTDTYVTGFTYSDNNLTLLRNQGLPNLTVNINTMTGLTVNGDFIVTGNTSLQSTSATTLNLVNLPTQNNSATDILSRNSSTGEIEFIPKSAITPDTNTFVTGYTYDNLNTFTINQNNGSTFNATINNVSGLTVNGILSATTLIGDGNGITNIDISSINNLQTSLDNKIDKPSSPEFDEYLYYNGSNWVSNKIEIPVSAGASVTFYLNTSGGTLGGYDLLSSSPTLTAQTIDSVTVNNSISQIQQYSSEYLNRNKIDAGIWEFNIYAGVDNLSTGYTNILISTYLKTTGGTETLLFTGATNEIISTGVTLYTVSIVQPDFISNVTDRLIVRYSGSTTNNTNTTIDLYHGGIDNYSHIHTPFITLHNDLTGIQGGSSNNYYHLELSQLNLLTTGVDASSLHNHYSTVLGLSGGTVSGTTNFINGIYTNTISATTYQNLPLDVYVTGGTYNSGTATFTNNNGGTFNVTGFTSTDTFTTGFTYSNNNLTLLRNQGQPNLSVNVNTMTGLTVNGTLSSTTIYTNSIGVKTTTPSFDLEVNGTFGATSKSFVINHPTQEGKKLVYGAIEGPEFGVYVRGKVNGNVIELPEEWTGLVDESTITVHLTGDGLFKLLYVKEILNNKVYISNLIPFVKPTGYYTIYGERKDINKLKTVI